MTPLRRTAGFVVALLVVTLGSQGMDAASVFPGRFLIASAPRNHKVSYAAIFSPHGSSGGSSGPIQMQDLITESIVAPMGLAVDQVRSLLFVADPQSRKIWQFALRVDGRTLHAGPAEIAADHTEARWVAVDGLGNIFFSDEPSNTILRISAANALRGQTAPETMYDGTSLNLVSAPGGIATDNFFSYWVNKNAGITAGSVIRASARSVGNHSAGGETDESAEALARNVDRSYGLCLAMGNLYYTQSTGTMSGVKTRGGSAPVTISNTLTSPRGCAWDGDGTVYVADRGANTLYSFAGNMQELATTPLTPAASLEDAFGVVVFSAASRLYSAPLILLLLSATMRLSGALA